MKKKNNENQTKLNSIIKTILKLPSCKYPMSLCIYLL